MIARELVAVPEYLEEVVRGLTSHPKTLPCKLFYDERGSALFEEITRLPEYYPTRTELEILQDYSQEIARAAGSPVSIVELGAGTALKTTTLLGAFARRQMRLKYFPVDISPAALGAAKKRVKDEYPGALVRPIIVDFSNGFRFLRDISGRKIVLYLGSSIGNFDWNDAVAMLRKVCAQLAPDDGLLLGTDMVKSPEILVPAYDDAQGITEQFNKNILVRLNRELDGDFDLESFRHIDAGAGGLFANPRFDRPLPRRRADSYREQLQVHRGEGRNDALRFGIQAGKNVVRPAELVRITFGAGVAPSQPGRVV